MRVASLGTNVVDGVVGEGVQRRRPSERDETRQRIRLGEAS